MSYLPRPAFAGKIIDDSDRIAKALIEDVERRLAQIRFRRWAESRPSVDALHLGSGLPGRIQSWHAGDLVDRRYAPPRHGVRP